MKIQKLQFALTSLHNLLKNNKQITKKRIIIIIIIIIIIMIIIINHQTVTVKANKKRLIQISNPLKFLPNV